MNKYKKRKLKEKFNLNKAKYLSIIFVLFVVVISIGYGAFNDNLSITGTGRIDYEKQTDVDSCPSGTINATLTLSSHNTGTNTYSYSLSLIAPDGNINIDSMVIKAKAGTTFSSSQISSYTIDDYGVINLTPQSWMTTIQNWNLNFNLNFVVYQDNWSPEYIQINGCTVYGTYTPPVVVTLKGISFNTNTLYLTQGSTDTLTIITNPTGFSINPTWQSSNPTVATINNGLVEALSPGTTTITATEGDFTATCLVTVGTNVIPITGLALSDSTRTIELDQSYLLTYTKTPSNATETVSWSSSDTSIVTVDNGLITGVSAGTATVSVSRGSIVASCTITVIQTNFNLTKLEIVPNEIEIDTEETVTLSLVKTPYNATNEITWSSSNPSIASVNNGVVTGITPGRVVITAESGNISAICVVNVIANIDLDDIEIVFQAKSTWGGGMNFTINVTNNSPFDLAIIRFVVDLPSNASLTSYGDPGIIGINGSTVTLEFLNSSWGNRNKLQGNGGTYSLQGQATFPSNNASSYANANITVLSVE